MCTCVCVCVCVREIDIDLKIEVGRETVRQCMCEKGIDTIYVFNTFRTDLLILIVRYCSSGSLQKVDATYLSPHVNMAARLETASRQYGKWT